MRRGKSSGNAVAVRKEGNKTPAIAECHGERLREGGGKGIIAKRKYNLLNADIRYITTSLSRSEYLQKDNAQIYRDCDVNDITCLARTIWRVLSKIKIKDLSFY